MSGDIVNFRQLERIRKLRYTARGTLRQRLPKGFRQAMRQRVLGQFDRSQPDAIEKLTLRKLKQMSVKRKQ